METKKILIEDREHIEDALLMEAAQILREGGLVAFPTETVYGLGGNALDEKASEKIYAAKGRPSDNPLIAHVSCIEEVEPLVSRIPEAGRRLMEAYWPGPLTLIFPKSKQVPYATTGGLETVAIRMPSDPVAQRLIALAGVPVAAPSANTSGRPSPTTAQHVWDDLAGRIDMIIDGGPVGIGLESTIVDVSGPVPTVLRPGAVTMEMLEDTLGKVAIDPAILGPMAEGERPKAPGMKYKHYAPKCRTCLFDSAEEAAARFAAFEKEGQRAYALCESKYAGMFPKGRVLDLGDKPEEMAARLYALLREGEQVADVIVAIRPAEHDGIMAGVLNRLNKACAGD